MEKKNKTADPLVDLLEAAKPETLITLIAELATGRPNVRRECLDYLKKHVALTPAQKTRSEGEIVMALWLELSPDLEELDDCGGGDYRTVDHVAGLLDEIRKKLVNSKIEERVRREILDEVLPFIKSGNAGLDDPLYDLDYAT